METNGQGDPSGGTSGAGGLLDGVQAAGVSQSDAKAFVRCLLAEGVGEAPDAAQRQHQEWVAEHIIYRCGLWCSGIGGASALTSVVPGLGTVIALAGGAVVDPVACMKLQVDTCVCMCVAETFDCDLTRYVGAQAKQWLILDRDGGPSPAHGAVPMPPEPGDDVAANPPATAEKEI